MYVIEENCFSFADRELPECSFQFYSEIGKTENNIHIQIL